MRGQMLLSIMDSNSMPDHCRYNGRRSGPDEETNYIFSPIYYGDEESNYHYIYSFFYFFFQVQDNPKGLRVFFYRLGPSLHHPHGDGLQGRLPSQHLDPALPKLFWFTPTFPTCPTVAEQFLDIKRTSPEGNFNVADFPSFAISFATAPAALANCPPFPSVISMLCMAVPKGISVEVDSSF
ncbi:hypothetical protein Prudu_006154 [Prunus dulcis]|uniref:Uncharacterized protein ycf72 n=1 Tax=Prunus dulcis TaxID=3755 RepID=A0A4Y1QZ52_PRUDU|nr:hypothetical protein Prudu_006154 [Prunus dulcis]